MQIIGIPGASGVGLTGQVHVRVNSFTQVIDQTLHVEGTTNDVLVQFSDGEKSNGTTPYVEITATGMRLDVLGSSLTGDFTFANPGTGIQITASNVEMALQNPSETRTRARTSADRPAQRFRQPQHHVHRASPGTSAGRSRRTSRTSASAAPTASPSARTAISVSGHDAKLTIVGLELSGNFSFQRTGSGAAAVTHISADNVSLSLGTGVLSLKNGTGDFTISAAGISGRLAIDVDTIGITGLTLSSVALAVDPTSIRVEATARASPSAARASAPTSRSRATPTA